MLPFHRFLNAAACGFVEEDSDKKHFKRMTAMAKQEATKAKDFLEGRRTTESVLSRGTQPFKARFSILVNETNRGSSCKRGLLSPGPWPLNWLGNVYGVRSRLAKVRKYCANCLNSRPNKGIGLD